MLVSFSKQQARATGPRRREDGSAMVLFVVILCSVVMPLVGFGIDGTICLWAKTRLNAAADLAALAGARALLVGSSTSVQNANASSVATQYFNANFPAGILNTTNVAVPVVSFPIVGVRKVVQVDASADVKLTFLNFLGFSQAHIAARGQAPTRAGFRIMLTIGRSGILNAQNCAAITSGAQAFATGFSEGTDQMGLVTFMENGNRDIAMNTTFKTGSTSIPSALSNLQCGGAIGAAAAISMAHEQFKLASVSGTADVIVIFNNDDGNGYSSGSFPTVSSCNAGNPIAGVINTGMRTPQFFNGLNTTETAIPISATSGMSVTGAGCDFTQVSKSIAAIPTTDYYGNSAYTALTNNRTITNTGIKTVSGGLDPTDFMTINQISDNAAYNAYVSARNDNIRFYAVGINGLGNVSWMRYIVNDPTMDGYNSAYPSGTFYMAPSASGVTNAFTSIKSQILQLTQ